MKTPYNARVRCRQHPDEIAAICPACYEEAQRQQLQQWLEARRVAHDGYLATQRGAA